MSTFEIVIEHSGFVMDTSDDRDEALRIADARTKDDMIVHVIRPANNPPAPPAPEEVLA